MKLRSMPSDIFEGIYLIHEQYWAEMLIFDRIRNTML
jgi:hypothetical protein